MMIHLGVKLERQGNVPVPDESKHSDDYVCLLNCLKKRFQKDPAKWAKMASVVRGGSEETTTGDSLSSGGLWASGGSAEGLFGGGGVQSVSFASSHG